MPRLLIYYAHPGHRFSHANAEMVRRIRSRDDVTFVDLYAEYPRHDVSPDREQARLLEHDVILFQFPLFWYSTPSIIKEWFDLVLEHGFAYGAGGDKLEGKVTMAALTAAGPEEAYSTDRYQHYPLRTFLTPLEQTARLCGMRFPAPYVLFGSLRAANDGRIPGHADGYLKLVDAICSGRFDFDRASGMDVLGPDTLPLYAEV